MTKEKQLIIDIMKIANKRLEENPPQPEDIEERDFYSEFLTADSDEEDLAEINRLIEESRRESFDKKYKK